jgi:hypothetical protein
MEELKESELHRIDSLLHKIENEALTVISHVLALQREVTASIERIEAGRAADPKTN